MYSVARAFALFGGFVMCAMAILTTASVIGRAFFNSPISGDFELVAIGTGVAVFAFLPYCHLIRENVVVDFFLDRAPYRVKAPSEKYSCSGSELMLTKGSTAIDC